MNTTLGLLFGVLAMISWGTADFFVACSVRKTSTLKVLFWSLLTSVIIAFIVAAIFLGLPNLNLTIIGMILLCGLLSAVSWGAFYKGLQIDKVAIISPIANSWPVITIVISILFLGESLTWMQAIGVFFVIIGGALVSFKFKDLLKLKNPAVGVKYALVGVLGWGILFSFVGYLVTKIGWFFPMVLIKTITMLYLLIYFKTTKREFSLPKAGLIFIMLVGLFEVLAIFAYGLGISFHSTSLVAPIIAGVPMVTVILAKIIFKESIDINQKLGIVSVILGLVLLAV
ncbi:DMT family transporter [Candidatus Woesearchaeota archaeon]|nr:MAG: DMT family transporter [Candidatus Woesearchaeota archaeon]